jgi:hypothetical protein
MRKEKTEESARAASQQAMRDKGTVNIFYPSHTHSAKHPQQKKAS